MTLTEVIDDSIELEEEMIETQRYYKVVIELVNNN